MQSLRRVVPPLCGDGRPRGMRGGRRAQPGPGTAGRRRRSDGVAHPPFDVLSAGDRGNCAERRLERGHRARLAGMIVVSTVPSRGRLCDRAQSV